MTDFTRKYQLRNLGLPVIEDLEQLSELVRISESSIKKLLLFSEHYYFTFEIPKKSGGSRLIAQPSRKLKAIQSWILRNILDKLSTSEASKGFERHTSIYDNAFPHIGSNVLLSLDIDNFFPTIPANKVYGVFHSLGYSKKISSALTSLCTFNGFLPQGSPSSPKLANLVCTKLDSRIQGYAGKKGMTYTRYADDITLSCQSVNKIQKCRSFIQTIIREEGFRINKKKTRLAGFRKRKKVTGLIITANKAGIGRAVYREMRVKINNIVIGKDNNQSHVNGWLSYIYSVDKSNYYKLKEYTNKLCEKYNKIELASNLLLAEPVKDDPGKANP